jgi:hypothetical protein
MRKKRIVSKERDLAHLIAFDNNGNIVVEERLSFLEYYEELHPLIDSSEFRSNKGVVLLRGRLYNSDGVLTQEFECHYSQTGELVKSRSEHLDGTITEYP